MKFNFLHYLLQDKENYNKDMVLNQRVEIYRYLLSHLGKESLSLLKDKFIYFLKYKKISTLNRISLIFVFVFVIYFSLKLTFNYMGWSFQTKTVNDTYKVTEYVPDTIMIETRIKELSHTLKMNENMIKKKFNFVTFYTIDSTKTLKKFLERLGQIESGNNYSSRRPGSQYLGRWAMGDGARSTVGFGNISYEKFLSTPEIQDAAVILLLKHNYTSMSRFLKKYNNRIMRGYHLTTSGMLAMAHNVGPTAVEVWIQGGCQINQVPKDGNGPADKFLILGNYDLGSLDNN